MTVESMEMRICWPQLLALRRTLVTGSLQDLAPEAGKHSCAVALRHPSPRGGKDACCLHSSTLCLRRHVGLPEA